ncbi:hypothetical protein [Niveibacterium umoris]|uniref:Twin-arginine translocation pathway signal protein n=1 Tax=Niveibacterium umoris TaxID=1193620 RepID=A0A840BS25_9RHOO|nr:hypothetical protein [Niveibacterium umoris]MBB4014472.1 hypothetical protein [Niveibacterium umoris]
MSINATRRRFLFLGVSAGVATALGVVAAWPDSAALEDDAHPYGFLTTQDRAILAALAPAMLAGTWPADAAKATAETLTLLRGIDTALLGMPPRVRDDMRKLFGLLGRQAGRVLVAGSFAGWAQVDPARAAGMIQSWRDHALALMQQAYGGLHDLTMGVWYGNPDHFADCAYAGPPTLKLN